MLRKFVEGLISTISGVESVGWQHRIDREYLLQIEGITVTLLRRNCLPPIQHLEKTIGTVDIRHFLADCEVLTIFNWINIIEIQSLSNNEKFPPIYWCIITASGQYKIPSGGRYAIVFEQDFIYKLPGYYDQQAIKVQPPTGFDWAVSLWRANDPYPKRTPLDDDWLL